MEKYIFNKYKMAADLRETGTDTKEIDSLIVGGWGKVCDGMEVVNFVSGIGDVIVDCCYNKSGYRASIEWCDEVEECESK